MGTACTSYNCCKGKQQRAIAAILLQQFCNSSLLFTCAVKSGSTGIWFLQWIPYREFPRLPIICTTAVSCITWCVWIYAWYFSWETMTRVFDAGQTYGPPWADPPMGPNHPPRPVLYAQPTYKPSFILFRVFILMFYVIYDDILILAVDMFRWPWLVLGLSLFLYNALWFLFCNLEYD